jgi:hypothetical protein
MPDIAPVAMDVAPLSVALREIVTQFGPIARGLAVAAILKLPMQAMLILSNFAVFAGEVRVVLSQVPSIVVAVARKDSRRPGQCQ